MAESTPAKTSALWKWVVPTLLAAVLLYFSLKGVDWGRVWTTIRGAQWGWLVLTTLTVCLSSFLRGLRWRVLLNTAEHFGVLTVFWATMAGYLGNSFLPARAGEVVRTLLITGRSSLTRTFVLTTALSERMMDAIALVLWSSVVLLGVHPKPEWLDRLSRALAFVAAGGLLAVIVLPHTGNLCEAVVARLPLPERLRDKLMQLVRQILLGLQTFHSVRRLAAFVGYTVAIWTLDTFGIVLAARGLGIPISVAVAALLICGLGLGSALPSTPGYVGIFQFVAVSVLSPFGVAKDDALALILVMQALIYVVVVSFGIPGLYLGRSPTVSNVSEPVEKA